jgi:hypothetical protein
MTETEKIILYAAFLQSPKCDKGDYFLNLIVIK